MEGIHTQLARTFGLNENQLRRSNNCHHQCNILASEMATVLVRVPYIASSRCFIQRSSFLHCFVIFSPALLMVICTCHIQRMDTSNSPTVAHQNPHSQTPPIFFIWTGKCDDRSIRNVAASYGSASELVIVASLLWGFLWDWDTFCVDNETLMLYSGELVDWSSLDHFPQSSMFVPFHVHEWVIVMQSESKVFLFRRLVVLALLILGLS